MSQSDRAVKKFATQLARLDREVKSWRGAQADFTSIENGGNFTFKDSDGNVTAIMGGQDDGSNTIRHVDGPTPPVPAGLSAHVDGPIVQVSWDGTFEDADNATYDWSHLEVVAAGPNNEQLTATINDVTGASTSVAATASGEWTVVARSVSRAEKRSLDGDAGTVDVELVGLTGAINDAIGSANGKNTVTYAETAPTPADEGIVGDTWWVGQVGRPNDIVEATNLATNPSFQSMSLSLGTGNMSTRAGAVLSLSNDWSSSGDTSLKIPGGTSWYTSAYVAVAEGDFLAGSRGKTFTAAIDFHLEAAHDDTIRAASRRLTVNVQRGGVMQYEFAASNKGGSAAGTTERLSVTFTVPADAEAWNITAFNGSQSSVSYWDSFDLAEVSSPRPYFDGDTPSGDTDNEPHYRWTGTPHASTSEKYLPAIPDSGSDSWNITEQWQYTSSGWKPVEVSHQVIATVDLGKATVGELDGIRIMGQTVRGEQLSGDAIDGKVITGGTYRTTGGTGSWSDDGLFIAQPDGTSMVRFPTDGSPLSLTASDTQIERASIGELDVSYGAVRSGGEFTLASGVTAPASPPELTTGWQKVASLQTPDVALAYDWLGLGYWDEGDGHWVRAVNVLGTEGDTLDEIHVYSVDGVFEQAIKTGLNPRHGVTVIGDIAYVLGPDYSQANIGKQWVHGLDLNTGERVSRFEFPGLESGRRVALCSTSDGMLVNVVVTVAGDGIAVRTRNPVTGVEDAARSWNAAWPKSAGTRLEGAALVGDMLYVTSQDYTRAYEIDGNQLNRVEGVGWTNPNRNGAGMVMRVGRFGAIVPFVVDGAGAVYEGSQFTLGTPVVANFTWFDGTNETTPSPEVSGFVSARESPAFSMPTRAGLQKRLYFRFGTGNWNRVTLPETLTVLSWMDALNYTPVSAPPPTTNTFPNADPATLKSTNDKFEVKGDGSGKWGPLTFNADGSMSGLPIAAGTVAGGPLGGTGNPGNSQFTVNLPPGKFTTPPVVTYTTASPRIIPAVDEITATSFRVRLYNLTDAVAPDTTIQWIAVGI